MREPLVFIIDGGETASPRFTVHPLSGVDLRSRSPDSVELVIGKCGPTGTCPPVDDTASPGSGVALVVYDFFSLNYVLAPLCFGGLLGLAIGGLAQRPGRVGAIVAGVVLLGIVSFLVWVGFSVSRMGHEQQGYGGMALMAFLAVGIAGYALLVAALWAGIRVTGAGFKSA